MQVEALKALIQTTGRDKPLSDVVQSLVQHVVTKENAVAFSRDTIMAATDCYVAQEADSQITEPMSIDSSAVAVIRVLCEKSSLPLDDVIGQILWYYRKSSPLQLRQHRKTAESIRWAANDSSKLEEVFRAYTWATNGHMRWRHWQQAVHLVQRNPVLKDRIMRADADRLFYTATARHSINQNDKDGDFRCIDYKEFVQLLLMLAETSHVHPLWVFNAVGCNAESLTEDLD